MSRAKRSPGLRRGFVPRNAAPAERFPESRRTVLKNGVTVVVAETPGLHSATLAAYVRAGSRHETEEVNGVSHFLEHLLFRGSEGYPDTLVMNGAVESAGGSLNAVTARDYSCYYTPIHPAELETGLSVLGDLLGRPLFRDMDVERQVILEEILDEVDARGRDVDPDNLAKLLVFGRHPLGFKIAGTPRTIHRLRESDIRAHHKRLYTGPNVVLSAAGPVRFEEVLAIAERRFGTLPRGAKSTSWPAPRWPAGPLCKAVSHEDAQAEFTLAFPSVPEHHPDHPAALCLRRLLDDGLSSRLPYEIVERKGLAYSIHSGLETYEDIGLFSFEGACSPAKLRRVLGELLGVLKSVCDEAVPADEILRAQVRHRMALTFALDNPQELVGWFGTGEILGSPEQLEERCRRVEEVTASDVRRVAQATFCRKNVVAVAVGPDAGRLRRHVRQALEAGLA